MPSRPSHRNVQSAAGESIPPGKMQLIPTIATPVPNSAVVAFCCMTTQPHSRQMKLSDSRTAISVERSRRRRVRDFRPRRRGMACPKGMDCRILRKPGRLRRYPGPSTLGISQRRAGLDEVLAVALAGTAEAPEFLFGLDRCKIGCIGRLTRIENPDLKRFAVFECKRHAGPT